MGFETSVRLSLDVKLVDFTDEAGALHVLFFLTLLASEIYGESVREEMIVV